MSSATMDYGLRPNVSGPRGLRILYVTCDVIRTLAAPAGFLLAAGVIALTPVTTTQPAPGDTARAIAVLAALVAALGWVLAVVRILRVRRHGW